MLCLMLLSGAANAWIPSEPLPDRPGTIEHALAQAAGTSVTLDGVCVTKISGYNSPAYIVVADPWEGSGTIIVKYYPSTTMRLGMTVEVSGVVSTIFVAGQKTITSAVVKGYKKSNGVLLTGPIGVSKPDDVPLNWVAAGLTQTTSGTLSGGTEPSMTAQTPNKTTLPEATYYSTIASTYSEPDGTWVWLNNKRIVERGDDSYGSWVTIAADNSADVLKCYYSGFYWPLGEIADRCYSVQGLLGHHGDDHTISTTVGPDKDYWLCRPYFAISPQGTIGWAKLMQDTSFVSLPGKVVSAVFPGYVYICEESRLPGIRVITSRVLSVGNRVNISSAIITTTGERCLTQAKFSIVPTSGGSLITPLGMNNKTLGGGGANYVGEGSTHGQMGVYGGIGVNTIGLLVRIWGRITYIYPTTGLARWYVVDDGTGLAWDDNGTSRTGVKVSLGDNSFLKFTDPDDHLQYEVGDYVEGVTGISSTMMIGDVAYRCLRQVGNFRKGGPSWWPVNKINRAIKSR